MTTDYAFDRARAEISALLAAHDLPVAPEDIRDAGGDSAADLAVPLFKAAKQLKRNPIQLAEEIAPTIDLTATVFASADAKRGYLNFTLDPARFNRAVTADFRRDPEAYGRSDVGAGRTIVIDYSSPNIAKPFSVGHLRSTIIGQALHNVLTWLGYTIIGDNHLGDWGTQFGKLLCAYNLWGDEAELARTSTGHLLQLYVRFHEEAKQDPALEQQARDWFRRLETGDPQARELWQRFVELSSVEFGRIYDLLGVSIDETLGESFYQDRLDELVERALNSGVARREQPPAAPGDAGASAPEGETTIIPLTEQGIDTPLILRKSDGTSLYATREIATAEYRIERWRPERLLYVVGNEQELYFRQLNLALKLLGHDTPVVHVRFGLIRLPEGRMSTRAGRVILLEDVIAEAMRRARAIVADRDMTDEDKDRVARVVGIGAIKNADLSQSRIKEVVFTWDKMLALDGDSAPYLQYAHTRCRSILRKAADFDPAGNIDPGLLVEPEAAALIRQIARFPDTIAAAAASYEPHRIAGRLYAIARDFSAFYNKVPVLKAEPAELRHARLFLVSMTGTVLRLGLALLGIEVPDRM